MGRRRLGHPNQDGLVGVPTYLTNPAFEREQMRIPITRDDIEHAMKPSPWDLGNKTLYSLCLDYPTHDQGDEIIAKVWLIGRAYAAAIERGRKGKESAEDFYETTVAEGMKNSPLDEWLSSLPERMTDPWLELGEIVAVHKRLTDLFTAMIGLEKRSLASKYLHFHRPDLFFIYDSRASSAAIKATPSLKDIRRIAAEQADGEYLALVRRCQWIRDYVERRFDAQMTPRQVDTMLLSITERMKKMQTSGSEGGWGMDHRPKRFHASIGGYMGRSYSVELVGDQLKYEACGQGYAKEEEELISVTGDQWATFRASLDWMGVWEWQEEYENPGVMDGTRWRLEIAYDDMEVRSGGDNNYPESGAKDAFDAEVTPEFRRFLDAVRTMIGGRDFD